MRKKVVVTDIIDHYDDPQPLSQGGQKVVFTVQHPRFGRCVLKIGYYNSPSVLERIRREVAVLDGLDSEYFPRHLHFEVFDAERYILLEELLEGKTLDECYSDFHSEDSVAALGTELVQALSQLWERRIVHRDLKPGNIIITAKGPRVIDLGIARLLDSPSLTQSLAPYGPCTPAYAAPEQLENRKRDIDYRTDQFSLGIVLTQLLLHGKHPFDPVLVGRGGSIPENILIGAWAKSELKATVPMLRILGRLLGREPYQRFRRAEDLRSELSALSGRQQ